VMGWGTRGQSKTPITKQSWEKGRGKEKTYPGAGYLYACCAFGDPGCGAPARTQNLFAFGLNLFLYFAIFHHIGFLGLAFWVRGHDRFCRA
jgi:hypothetical protein